MNPEYPGQQNPYDFIMNPQTPQKPKRGMNLFGGNSFIAKLVFIIGGVFLLMIITAVILNFTTANKIDTTDLKTLAQTQQEIIRISTDGMNGSRAQANRDMATSVSLSVQTQQQQLLAYLQSQGVKVADKDLRLKEDAQTTTQLENARNTSTYDVVFPQIMQKLLTGYSKDMQTIYDGMSNQNVRALLKTDYDQTQLLMKQIPVNAVPDDNSGQQQNSSGTSTGGGTGTGTDSSSGDDPQGDSSGTTSDGGGAAL